MTTAGQGHAGNSEMGRGGKERESLTTPTQDRCYRTPAVGETADGEFAKRPVVDRQAGQGAEAGVKYLRMIQSGCQRSGSRAWPDRLITGAGPY